MRTHRAYRRGLLLVTLGSGAMVTAAFAQVYPGSTWETATPEKLGMDPATLDQARVYALGGGGAGMIVRSGRLVATWGNTHATWDVKSTTKSLGSLLLGIAAGDGLLALDDAALDHLSTVAVPPSSSESTGWIDDLTVRALATHSGGFPGGSDYAPFLYQPGTAWYYSDCGADWLADVLTVTFGQDLEQVFRTRILGTVGIPLSEFTWRSHWYRPSSIEGITRREFGSGVTASVDALARIGHLCLRQGLWEGASLVPAWYTEQMGQADASIASLPNLGPVRFPGATAHYGLFWWNNADGTLDAPLDTYFAWGLYESLIVVIPSLDVVAARAGGGWQDPFTADYGVVAPFIEPIAASVTLPTAAAGMEFESWARVKSRYRESPVETTSPR